MAVYAWGANSHGQLGLGFESELCMTPQQLKHLSFSPTNVRCIRGGGGHLLVLDNCGRLHACGWNNRGQLGLNSTQECFNEFQAIPSEYFDDVAIESIACGWDISGCITATKKLYVWGSNSFQQLGICQREFNSVRRPFGVMLPRAENAHRVSFGLRHCAVLTSENNVYVFGRLRINEPVPTELCITATSLHCATVQKILPSNTSELRITAICSGQNHLLLRLTDIQYGLGSKRMVALGDNKFGQSNFFQFDDDVRQLAVGWTHNALVLKDKRINVWGRNCYGQLGTGSFTDSQPTPMELKLPDEAVVAWLHTGSEHTLARTTEGRIYTWGWNEHGNCGNDSTENLCKPTLINLPSPCRLAGAGAGFCYAICDDAA